MPLTVDAALLQAVEGIAREAAATILSVYETDFAVRNKSDGSPVTEADMAAHELIKARLAGLDPEVAVVSEEDDSHRALRTSAYDQFWLVDPLDGTRGFTNRNGDFAVNIGLVQGTKAVLGVVNWVVRGLSFAGARGIAATCTDEAGEVRHIRVSERSEHPLTLAISRSRNNPLTRRFTEDLGSDKQLQRGSAIKSCLVASGEADLYPAFSETWYWDTAAPQAMLEAAGGLLTDLHLEPLRYDLSKGLRNPKFIAAGVDPELWRHALPRLDSDTYW